MINIAARATNEILLPNRQTTREIVIATFKKQMNALKKRLNVSLPFDAKLLKMLSDGQSNKVKGSISLTQDVWTASNGDSYLTVTL